MGYADQYSQILVSKEKVKGMRADRKAKSKVAKSKAKYQKVRAKGKNRKDKAIAKATKLQSRVGAIATLYDVAKDDPAFARKAKKGAPTENEAQAQSAAEWAKETVLSLV